MRPRVILALTLLTVAAAGPALAGFAGTDVFLPMVGRNVGVYPSNWYTTVWIYNPGPATVTARLYFLERNKTNLSAPWVDVMVPGGATEKLDNPVEALFHVQVFGAIRVTAPAKVVVTSRVYSKVAGADEQESVGQDFAGVPASFAIGVNEKSQILGCYQTQPTAASEYRYNFGFVETTGHQATVRVTARDEAGIERGTTSILVREYSQKQMAFKDYFPSLSTENTRLEIEVTAGSGKVIGYGSAVANGSQDPTTYEMTYSGSLLGALSVQHDSTLVGDGTAASLLGLADGAVTNQKVAPGIAYAKLAGAPTSLPPSGPAGNALSGTYPNPDLAWNSVGTGQILDGAVGKEKLAAVGGAAGQVLGTDGAGLVWQSAGLSLPFSGSGSTSGVTPLFGIANAGSGVGIEASSLSQDHLGRLVTADAGVFGHTMRCGGDYRGVMGLSTCTGSYGELGRPGEGVRGDGYAYGVHGSSSSGDGVFGESSAADKSGIFGLNTHPDGYAGFFNGHVRVANGYFSVAGLPEGPVCANAVGGLYGCPSFSDLRLKKDVRDLGADLDVLPALGRLRGVTFNWDTSVDRVKHLQGRREMGMIAQEVETVLPELVATDRDGYKSLDYAKLTSFLVEVAKLQQAELERLTSDIARLKGELQELRGGRGVRR